MDFKSEFRESQEECHNGSDDHNKEMTRIPRPPNAFMIFGQQFRKVLAKKFSDLSNKHISKLLGNQWQKLDEQTKLHYHRLAEEANRKHLQKYPGYYYSPLEARQRKAERKRKGKMWTTQVHHKNHGNWNPTNASFVPTFKRPFIFGPQMYSMVRPPTFGFPFPPRMHFSHQYIHFRPNYPFGGLGPMAPFPVNPYYSFVENSVKSEFIDVRQVSTDSDQQMYSDSEENPESETVDIETQEPDLPNQSADIGLLSSLLPPMHNPSTEVTPVLHNDSLFSDQNSLNERMVTNMVNAVVQQEPSRPTVIHFSGSGQQIKEEVNENECQNSEDTDSHT